MEMGNSLLATIRRRFHPLWKLRQSQVFRSLQDRFDPDWFTHVGQVRMHLKLLRDASYLSGEALHDALVRKKFTEIIRQIQPDLFMDIGANIGVYSWLALDSKPDLKIILFEPDTRNVRLLTKTIRNSTLQNCHLLPIAVADKPGTTTFYRDLASGATGSLISKSDQSGSLHAAYAVSKQQQVMTLPLDVWLNYVAGKKLVLKIDVEGAEKLVIEGGWQLIEQCLPIIFIEQLNDASLQKFKKLGYQWSQIDGNQNLLLMPANPTALERLHCSTP